MEKSKPRLGGMGKADALLLVFVGLKLGGQLDWSWWWVLSPYSVRLATTMAISGWRLSAAPSQALMKKEPSAVWAKWSGQCGASDALFLLFFVLKWTGHLSWSWLWVLSPLWLLKPLGILLPRPSKERRKSRDLSLNVALDAAALFLLALIALRLEGHIPSWWWIAPAFPLSLIFGAVLSMRMDAAFLRRLLREKTDRQERHRREGAPATPPTVFELWKERQQPSR